MPYFTVFTATYNRAYSLPRLYASLQQQTFTDFEWLVVDDGSTDDTQLLLRKWKQEENPFSIRCLKKDNGGKPRAINFGLTRAEGRYFFMVDSDDYLLPQALEHMHGWCEEIDDMPDMIGAGAARGSADGQYIKGVPPKVNEMGYVDATNLERKYYDLDADMCEAYKTEVFRQFPMAEWKNEKFAPEQIALNEISLAGYRLRWHTEIIYICEYLRDGLTKGGFDLVRKNPMGYAMMYNHMLRYPVLSRKEKFHAACQHIVLSCYGRHPGYILKSYRPGYTLLALPVGLPLTVRRWLQFRRKCP